MQHTLRLTDYWTTVFRRTWQGSIVTSFLSPLLLLTAMGVGLGGFVDDNAGPAPLGGVSYLDFIAPGLLAITAMQTAIGESTYPVLAGFKWQKFFFSMAATPLSPSDIVAGQLGFIAFRIVFTCSVFTVVLALFGAVSSVAGGVAAVLIAVVIGMAHATPMVALSARLKSESAFALVFRLGVLPMSLFSGAFFPITQLPDAITWIAYVTPIWHGVDLARMVTTGDVDALAAAGHLGYLLLWLLVGWYLAVRGFAKRLEQ